MVFLRLFHDSSYVLRHSSTLSHYGFSASPAKFTNKPNPNEQHGHHLHHPGPLSESQTCGRLPKWWWNKLKWVDVEWMWFDVCCAAKVTFWNIMPMYKEVCTMYLCYMCAPLCWNNACAVHPICRSPEMGLKMVLNSAFWWLECCKNWHQCLQGNCVHTTYMHLYASSKYMFFINPCLIPSFVKTPYITTASQWRDYKNPTWEDPISMARANDWPHCIRNTTPVSPRNTASHSHEVRRFLGPNFPMPSWPTR